MSQPFLHRAAALLRRTAKDSAAESDARLLARFAESHEEAAFAELVDRHGRLVRGAARRYLGDADGADDVFQATFLLLAQKAGSKSWGITVGPWLYAVAVRLAKKARSRSAHASMAEGGVVDTPAPATDPGASLAWTEIRQALDDELANLPARLREPLVLCFLQGRTRDEAARLLGWSLATLKRRLECGRTRLRLGLTRRGLTLSAAGFGVMIADPPLSLAAIQSTAAAAADYLAGKCASPSIAKLLGAAHSGWMSKLAAVVAMVFALCGVGAMALSGEEPTAQREQPAAPKETRSAEPAAAPVAHNDATGDPLPAGVLMRLGSTRLRPGGSIEKMVFSPDGKKIAAFGGENDTLPSFTVWDTATGKLLRRSDMPGGSIKLIEWLADGRGIAILGSLQAGGAGIWEFTDPKADPHVPQGRGGGPAADDAQDSCFAVSPDGKTIAIGQEGSADADRSIFIAPLKTGMAARDLPDRAMLGKQPGNCKRLVFTPDGKKLVAISAPRTLGNKPADEQVVVVWDVADRKESSRFVAPRPAANGERIAIAVSNGWLALGLERGDTSLWDLATGKERRLDTQHDSKRKGDGYGTFAVAFGPEGKMLATGGRDDVTKLWDTESGKLLHTLKRHFTWIEALAVSSDGKLVASAGQDGLIRLWDAKTGADACPLPGHKYAASLAALAPDGKTAITAGWDYVIRWWDAATGRELRHVDMTTWISGLTISPDGRTLLATIDSKLRTWDVASGRETTPGDLPADAKFGKLIFTPDGKNLVAASGTIVSIWEWPSLKRARTIEMPKPQKQPGENRCESVTISPDGRWLVTVATREWSRYADGLNYGYAADGVVDVWDFATGKRVRRLAESQGCFKSANFTADGRLVVIGASGTIPAANGPQPFKGNINLLDPIAARWVRSFSQPPASVRIGHLYHGATELSPDGRLLYVTYNTGDVVAFEVATGKARRLFAGHRGYVGGIGLSPDGRRAITAGHDGTALIWDTTLAAVKPDSEVAGLDREKLWEAVGSGDGIAAGSAMSELVRRSDKAVALMRERVKPVPAAPSAEALDQIFKDFDSMAFGTRESAARKLADFGESAVPGVRKRLEKPVSAEVRQRAEAFLNRFDKSELTPERLREIRAIEVLEEIGNGPAKEYLTELARGAAGAPITEDAATALKRLGKR